MNFDWIEIFLFLPLVGALAVSISPVTWSKVFALVASTVSGVIGILCAYFVIRHPTEMGWYELHPWLPSYSIVFKLGLDGTNVAWILLISFLFPMILIFEATKKNSKSALLALLLLLQGFLVGTALSQDLFLLEFFWTATILPVYFLLGFWTNEKNKSSAEAFLVQSLLGNAILFFGFLLLYHVGEAKSFDLQELKAIKATTKVIRFLGHDLEVGPMSFVLVLLGLLLRMPLWPFRGWIRSAFRDSSVTVLCVLVSCLFPSTVFLFERIQYVLFRFEMQEIRPVLLMFVGVNLFFALGGLTLKSTGRDLLDRASLILFIFCLGSFLSFTENGYLGSLCGVLNQGFALAAFSFFLNKFEPIGVDVSAGGFFKLTPRLGVLFLSVCLLVMGVPGLGQFFSNGVMLSGVTEFSFVMALVLFFSLCFLVVKLFWFFSTHFLGDLHQKPGASVALDMSSAEAGFYFVLLCGSLTLGLLPGVYFDGLRMLIGWSK